MIYGFDKGKFYIDFISCDRPVGNMRQESDRRALQLAETGGKFMLGNSGGLDSQSVLNSFRKNDIPIETAFLYLPGYNDNEYDQVRIIDKKYQIKTHIVDLDPIHLQKEVEELSNKLDITAKNNVLQAIFLNMLPTDYNFIQMVHDPFVYVHPDYNQFSYFQGYYLPEISRERAFKSLNRSGKNIFYGDSPEFLLSIIDDDIYHSALKAARYFDGNGAKVEHKYLKTVDRWDFYIKPLIYGKYWGDDLIYFPKFAGFEKVEYLHGNKNFKKYAVMIDYYELINFLKTPGSITKRYYENVIKEQS